MNNSKGTIKFVFIGNPVSVQEIGYYPEKNVDIYLRETNQIFERYSGSQTKGFDQRSKVVGSDGNYCFLIKPSNVFYLVLASYEASEREIFMLIDDIEAENIPLLIDTKTQKLNLVGRQQLKTLIDHYHVDRNNKIKEINIELKETKEIVGKSIKEIVSNVDKLDDLEQKAVGIKETANEYNKNAAAVKKMSCWQNCKWTIVIIVIIALLLVIIIPISVSLGKKTNSF